MGSCWLLWLLINMGAKFHCIQGDLTKTELRKKMKTHSLAFSTLAEQNSVQHQRRINVMAAFCSVNAVTEGLKAWTNNERGRKSSSKFMRETAQQRAGTAGGNICRYNHSRDKGKTQKPRELAVSNNLNIKVQSLEWRMRFSNITSLNPPHYFSPSLLWFDYLAAQSLILWIFHSRVLFLQ